MGEQTGGVLATDSRRNGRAQESVHRVPFFGKQTRVALRFGQCHCSPKGGKAGGWIAPLGQRDRLKHEELDNGSGPASRLGGSQQAPQQVLGFIERVFFPRALELGDEHPDEGDVVKLVEIAELVAARQALIADPIECLGEPTLQDPSTDLHGANRTDIWDRSAHKQGLALLEPLDRAIQVAPRDQQSRVSTAPPNGCP